MTTFIPAAKPLIGDEEHAAVDRVRVSHGIAQGRDGPFDTDAKPYGDGNTSQEVVKSKVEFDFRVN